MLENASGDRHLTDDVYGCMAVWAFWPAAKLGKPWHDHPILGSGRLLAPPERSWIVHGSHHILSIFSDASGLIIRLVVWTLSPFCGHILILLIMSLFSLILIIILSYSHPPTVKCSPGLVLDLFFLGSHQNGVYDMIGGWNRSHCLFFFYTQQDVYAILAIAYHNVPGPSGGMCVQRDCDTEGGGSFWPTLKYYSIKYYYYNILQCLWQNIGYHKPNGLVIWCRNPRNPSLWLGSNVVVHIFNVFIVHACGKPNHTQRNFSLGCKIFLRPSILVITPILVR